ncbi:hypothetical protein B5S31_g2851 [[Candida] boidinii]|nr:hypothetical protein B5S31_g2851 [[Candida] boidinii]
MSEEKHSYSTRSKDSQVTKPPVQKKTNKRRIVTRYKPFPYTLADIESSVNGPTLNKVLNIDQTPLYTTDNHPFNKRGFKYDPCRPNPFFKSTLYSTTESPPYQSRLSYFDRSPGFFIDSECLLGTVERGWQSSRTNVGFREGNWYVEFKILRSDGNKTLQQQQQLLYQQQQQHGQQQDHSHQQLRSVSIQSVASSREASASAKSKSRSNTPEVSSHADIDQSMGHVRIGFARREASIEAPVGMDGYGYGLRDKTGQKVHLSRPSHFMKEGFGAGDVIGMLIELPSLEVQKEICNLQIQQKIYGKPNTENNTDDNNDGKNEQEQEHEINRDKIPIRYRNHLYFEQYEYTTSKAMEHLLNPVTVFGEKAVPDVDRFKPALLPDSKIVVYKNGELVGTAFKDLYAFLPPSSEQSQALIMKNKFAKNNKDITEFSVCNDDGSLGYYPMISCFKTGSVEINSSKDLIYPPKDLEERIKEGDVNLFHQRYDESIIENYVWDLIDEVENEYLDEEEEKLR